MSEGAESARCLPAVSLQRLIGVGRGIGAHPLQTGLHVFVERRITLSAQLALRDQRNRMHADVLDHGPVDVAPLF